MNYMQEYEKWLNSGALTAEELNDLMIAQFTSMTFNGLTGSSMTWGASGQVSKDPKGMIIRNGAYAGLD